ncbi:hypothetical protein V5T82_17910 [Magnetovibrio sp. PR-2]|uniref:hypothetical protein n=1 Tax=Magnetovibrio sp. PR-2 TaxID=3120356 RepID=UPI002FCE638F
MSMDEDMKRLMLLLMKHHGCDEEYAGDVAAASFLADGEVEPLLKWLEADDRLTPILRKALIAVLTPGTREEMKTAYQLVPKRRAAKKGAPKDRLRKLVRDGMVGIGVAQLIDEYGPGGYEAAIEDAAKISNVSKGTVTNAYTKMKKYHSKKS